MKFRHIMTFFLITLPFCVALRSLQLIFTVENNTGFIKQQYSGISAGIMVVIFAAIAVLSVTAMAVNRPPYDKHNMRPGLALFSIAVSVVFIYELTQIVGSMNVNLWQNFLLIVLCFLSALFFMAYGITNVYYFKIPPILYLIPVFYSLIKLIVSFVSVASIALISDNVFMLLTNSAILVFMLEFAKYANNINNESNYKKLLGTGMAAVTLCFTSTLPQLIAATCGKNEMLHESVSSIFTTIFIGVFIISFLISFYGDTGFLYQKHNNSHLA